MPYRWNKHLFALRSLQPSLTNVPGDEQGLVNLLIWLKHRAQVVMAFGKVKVELTSLLLFPKSNDDGALPFLRNAKVKGIEHFPLDKVPLPIKFLQDGRKCSALVMRGQLLDILQQKCLWPMVAKNPLYLEEHCSARIGKSLHLSHDGERLAGKSSQQKLMGRNGFSKYASDITRWTFPKIGLVGVTGCFVPFR